MAVALCDRAEFAELDAFQRRLGAAIGADGADRWGDETERRYYEHWLRALEALVVETGAVSASELHERASEFQAEERDASEFVEGERDSAHDHSHPH